MTDIYKRFPADLLLEVQPKPTAGLIDLPFESAVDVPGKLVNHRLCLSYTDYCVLQQAVLLGILACRTLHVGAALTNGLIPSAVDGVTLNLSHLVSVDPDDPGTDWMYDAEESPRFESVIRSEKADSKWDWEDAVVLAQLPMRLTVQVRANERFYPLRGEDGGDLNYRVFIRGTLGDRGEWVVELNSNDLTD